MKINIIGAGALGKLYGGLLSLSGHDVHFLLRSEYNQITAQGYFEMNVQVPKQTISIKQPKVVNKAQDLPQADLTIITVKTTDNHTLASLLASSKDTTLLIIQNGIGNEEFIEKLCPTHPIVSAISNAAVTRTQHAAIDVYFLGELRLAPYKPKDNALCTKIQNLFTGELKPKIKIFDNYKLMRWQKLLWNIPYGVLSILYDKPSDVLSYEPYAERVHHLMQDIQNIAHSEGISISDEYLQGTLEASRNLKDYYASMYWDYKQGKKIEDQYIIANALSVANTNKVAVPYLNKLKTELDELTTQV